MRTEPASYPTGRCEQPCRFKLSPEEPGGGFSIHLLRSVILAPTHTQAFEIPSAPLCRLGDGVNPDLKFQKSTEHNSHIPAPSHPARSQGPCKATGTDVGGFHRRKSGWQAISFDRGPEMPKSEQGDLQTTQAPPC